MVLVVFRSRLREGVEADITALGEQMYNLVSGMSGFLSYREYAAADGESLSIAEFDSPEALAAWRTQPEHVEAQRRGREEFFSEYHIQVCTIDRAYAFP